MYVAPIDSEHHPGAGFWCHLHFTNEASKAWVDEMLALPCCQVVEQGCEARCLDSIVRYMMLFLENIVGVKWLCRTKAQCVIV